MMHIHTYIHTYIHTCTHIVKNSQSILLTDAELTPKGGRLKALYVFFGL